MSLESTSVAIQEAHTPGVVAVGGTNRMAIYAGGNKRVGDCNVFEVPHQECQANARRIATLWNACLGIPTEVLERIAAEPSDRERLRLLGDAGYDYRLRFEEIQNVNVQL